MGGPSDVLAGLDKTATKHKDAGVYTDGWTFSNANYQDDSGTVTDEIDQVGSTTTVSCATPFTYNGSPHSCDASWLSNGADLEGGPLTVHYEGRNGTTYPSSTTAPTNAGDYTASASYAGDTNHSSSQDSEDYSIGKATADCSTITGYTVDYDGAFHTASGDCTGVGGPSDVLAGLDKTATKHKDAGVYTDGSDLQQRQLPGRLRHRHRRDRPGRLDHHGQLRHPVHLQRLAAQLRRQLAEQRR